MKWLLIIIIGTLIIHLYVTIALPVPVMHCVQHEGRYVCWVEHESYFSLESLVLTAEIICLILISWFVLKKKKII